MSCAVASASAGKLPLTCAFADTSVRTHSTRVKPQNSSAPRASHRPAAPTTAVRRVAGMIAASLSLRANQLQAQGHTCSLLYSIPPHAWKSWHAPGAIHAYQEVCIVIKALLLAQEHCLWRQDRRAHIHRHKGGSRANTQTPKAKSSSPNVVKGGE